MNLTDNDKALLEILRRGYTVDKNGIAKNPKGLIVGKTTNRYDKISVKINKITFSVFVHKIQAYLKFGNKIFEKDIIVRHKNDISKDNTWDNILIGSFQENSLDVPKEKRILNSLNSTLKTRKYSNELILKVREELKTKTVKEISKLYNIPTNTIYWMKNNQYLFENENIDENKFNVKDFENKMKKYSNLEILNIKNMSLNMTHKQISEKLNISIGMIQYLVNR